MKLMLLLKSGGMLDDQIIFLHSINNRWSLLAYAQRVLGENFSLDIKRSVDYRSYIIYSLYSSYVTDTLDGRFKYME